MDCKAPCTLGLLAALALTTGCKDDEPKKEDPVNPELGPGEACDPSVEPFDPETDQVEKGEELPPICGPGLACAPLDDDSGHVCGTALEIRGRITDAETGDAIEGALVAALDETSTPVTDVVATDACGDYVLPLTVRRASDGTYAEDLKWTLFVSAAGYQPFPAGLRPAIPLDMSQAVPDPDPPPPEEGEDPPEHVADIIENAATRIALIPLEDKSGVTVSGTVGGMLAPGTLVVAEGGPVPAPYGLADASGNYTVFNVPTGDVTMVGYRQDLELEPAALSVSQSTEGVDLAVITEDPTAMGSVTGSLNLVNPGDGSETSVVLIPASVFNDSLERGPVPVGLRDPSPPTPPDVTGAFALEAVPAGTYKVLVAFENDFLVRDPDPGIAGTGIQEVTLAAGADTMPAESFKVTGALGVVGPGADDPELVDAAPTFEWEDDSSEDHYELEVYDTLGNKVWEDPAVPGVSGANTVVVDYGGPALEAGMYYQFRATSIRMSGGNELPASRTEDLRGVFVFGEGPAPAECTLPEEGETDGGDTDTDGSGG